MVVPFDETCRFSDRVRWTPVGGYVLPTVKYGLNSLVTRVKDLRLAR